VSEDLVITEGRGKREKEMTSINPLHLLQSGGEKRVEKNHVAGKERGLHLRPTCQSAGKKKIWASKKREGKGVCRGTTICVEKKHKQSGPPFVERSGAPDRKRGENRPWEGGKTSVWVRWAENAKRVKKTTNQGRGTKRSKDSKKRGKEDRNLEREGKRLLGGDRFSGERNVEKQGKRGKKKVDTSGV